MKRIIIAIMLTCLVTPALGANAQGDFIVLGVGSNSCGKWTAERNNKSWSALGYSTWANGFITAYSAFVSPNVNVAAETDHGGRSAWIDNYCAANPLDDIADAVNALIDFLKAR